MLSSPGLWRTRMRQRLQRRIDRIMENLALRQQLMVYERGRTPRRSLSGADRLLWCFIARFYSSWRDSLDIVQPATVTRWKRAPWWRHLFNRRRRRPGRPRIAPELQALIRQIARENPRWGSMRILGELRALGFEVSNSTVRRYRGTTADRSRQHWATFYRNHGPYLAEALRVAASDGIRLVLTWIASRLKLRRANFERDRKRRTTSARANLVVPAQRSPDSSRLPRASRPQLAHARDGPTPRRRAA